LYQQQKGRETGRFSGTAFSGKTTLQFRVKDRLTNGKQADDVIYLLSSIVCFSRQKNDQTLER